MGDQEHQQGGPPPVRPLGKRLGQQPVQSSLNVHKPYHLPTSAATAAATSSNEPIREVLVVPPPAPATQPRRQAPPLRLVKLTLTVVPTNLKTRGIANPRMVTCFANTALQVLAHASHHALRSWIECEVWDQIHLDDSYDGRATQKATLLFQGMLQANPNCDPTGCSLLVHDLLIAMGEADPDIYGKYAGHEQQNSSEFICHLLDLISKETNPRRKRQAVKHTYLNWLSSTVEGQAALTMEDLQRQTSFCQSMWDNYWMANNPTSFPSLFTFSTTTKRKCVECELVICEQANHVTPPPNGRHFPLLLLLVILFPTPCMAATSTPLQIPNWHPDIQAYTTSGTLAPDNHPLIHNLLSAASNGFSGEGGHPNCDTLISQGRRLPGGHPNIDKFVTYVAPVLPSPTIKVPWWHPSIDTGYGGNFVLPPNHPLVNTLFGAALPTNHPNVDSLLVAPAANPLPAWHPKLDEFVSFQTGYVVPKVAGVPWWHPMVDKSYTSSKLPLPSNHPSVNAFFLSILPTNHTNLDTLWKSPSLNPLPSWHPKLDQFVSYVSGFVVPLVVGVTSLHPQIDLAYGKGENVPLGHPLVHTYFQAILPTNHPNLDTLLGNTSAFPMPVWHPTIDEFVAFSSTLNSTARGKGITSLPRWHDNIDDLYRSGLPTPSHHLKFQEIFLSYLPSGHPNIDMLMEDPSKVLMPSYHPNIQDMLILRSQKWRRRQNKVKIGREGIREVESPTEVARNLESGKFHGSTDRLLGSGKGGGEQIPLRPLPPKLGSLISNGRSDSLPRNLNYIRKGDEQPRRRPPPPPLPARNILLASSNQLHQRHRGPPLYEYSTNLSTPPPNSQVFGIGEELEVKQYSTFGSFMTFLTVTRIPGTDWKVGNALWLLLFVLINTLSLLSPYYSTNNLIEIKLGFGSLAAANAMLLVIPATRNSVLTWFLGLPFDQVILYHRFLGRFALLCVLVHSSFYISQFDVSEWVHWTGLAAALFGLVIFVSSIDYIRRTFFTAFFWFHYAFIGFYLFAFLHLKESRAYLIIGMGFFGLDMLIRTLWSIVPRRCKVFRNRGDSVCQVRFEKSPITDFLGVHKVGQYFFVNFPEISLTEWHPFSVSSGCRETEVELHIRALGDHTKLIVDLAKDCGRSGRVLPWIRFEGPYGNHNFNFRRYPILFLVGGGIGITPVMGLIKEIYLVGKYSREAQNSTLPHRMEAVYVTWVLPRREDAECFLSTLKECISRSSHPGNPPLIVRIYITKEGTQVLPELYISGRPHFKSTFEAIKKDHPDLATLVFACGPSMMVAELWDLSVKHSINESRVDFFHDEFEF